MDVPVENANSLPEVLGVASRNRHVVEYAETGRITAFRVVTRRSNDAIATLQPLSSVVLLENCLHATHGGQNGEARADVALTTKVNIVGLVGNRELLVLYSGALGLDFLDILRGVIQREKLRLHES